MPGLNSAQDILATELKEIHSAERQLSRAMPRLIKKVSSDRLREMLEKRVEQGSTLIDQIEDVLAEMDTPKARQKNIAAEGLIEDANHHLEEIREDSLVDPVLLASVQKIEHYCIAAWGTAASMGRLLGQDKAVKAMERALKEGKRFDEELTKLAEADINPAALNEAEDTGGSEEQQPQSRSRPRKSR
jgi:ferritin-like metal-binding protein YciE